MTTRTEVLAAARAVAVRDGICPHCLRDLVEDVGFAYVYCPAWMDSGHHPLRCEVYSPETGEALGGIT